MKILKYFLLSGAWLVGIVSGIDHRSPHSNIFKAINAGVNFNELTTEQQALYRSQINHRFASYRTSGYLPVEMAVKCGNSSAVKWLLMQKGLVIRGSMVMFDALNPDRGIWGVSPEIVKMLLDSDSVSGKVRIDGKDPADFVQEILRREQEILRREQDSFGHRDLRCFSACKQRIDQVVGMWNTHKRQDRQWHGDGALRSLWTATGVRVSLWDRESRMTKTSS